MSTERVRWHSIERLSAARGFVPHWVELWARCQYATVFQSPEWVLGSWQWLAQATPRSMITGWCNGELVAVSVLRICSDELYLEGSEVSDYLDVLVDPSCREALAAPLFSFLREVGQGRRLRCERLTSHSPLLSMRHDAPEWQTVLAEQDVCPYVELSRSRSALGAVIPPGFLRRIQRARREAKRRFRVEVSSASTANVHERLARLFELHTTRWNSKGATGVLADPAIARFYSEVVPQLLAVGQVWLLQLDFDTRPVAALLSFCGHDRVLCYMAGFDSQYATYSPGRLLMAALFERAYAAGSVEVDFLRGVERYKYDWGARNRSTYCLALEPTESQRCTAR